MAEFEITKGITREACDCEGMKTVKAMLDDRLRDAEDEVIRAMMKVNIIKDMIHEVELIMQHLITAD